jgi:ubiquinone biosynthesis protein
MHEIYLPREWIIVFRALMTLDGVGKSIGIDIDLFKMLEGDIKSIIKKSVTKDDLIEEAVWGARSAMSSVRLLPRHMKWFMKEWSRKNYAIEIITKGYEKEMSSINSSLIFLGIALLSAVFINSGVVVLGDVRITSLQMIPLLSWIFWSLGFLMLVKGFLTLK